MLVTFGYSLCFGKGDSGESYVSVELTEEENTRLKTAMESDEEFINCKSVADIYNKVYDLADEDATDDLISVDMLEEGERASDLYSLIVYFPE